MRSDRRSGRAGSPIARSRYSAWSRVDSRTENARAGIPVVAWLPVTRDEMRDLVAAAPVGRLATVGAGGAPHLVPFCFALDGDVLYSAVDRKPKQHEAAALAQARFVACASGRVRGTRSLQETSFLCVMGGGAAHHAQNRGFVGKVHPSPHPFA